MSRSARREVARPRRPAPTRGRCPRRGARDLARDHLRVARRSSIRCPSRTSARPATFTHQAAVRHFGSSTHFVPVKNIADIFDEVERGPRRVRRGAGGELDRGRRQRHARPAHRLRRPDQRRADARHRAASPLPRAGPARGQERAARTRRRSPSAGMARHAPARRRRRGDAVHDGGGRAGEGRSDGGGDRLRDGRAPLRRADAPRAHRGQPVELHAVPRDRAPARRRPRAATRRRSSSR